MSNRQLTDEEAMMMMDDFEQHNRQLTDEEAMMMMSDFENQHNRQLTDEEVLMMMDDFDQHNQHVTDEEADDFEVSDLRHQSLRTLTEFAKCNAGYTGLSIGDIKLTIARQRSKIPGSINVIKNDEWCGRIIDGTFTPSRNISPAIINNIVQTLYDYARNIISYKSESMRIIYTMLEHVGRTLKEPCIYFNDFVLQFYNDLNIVQVGRYGCISRDGTFITNSNSEIINKLENFGQNPAESARLYGRLTGKCCFCNRNLTDARSVVVGYGPICARHYRLPYL